MESAYLKTLIEVDATGSFSKAAESLCITQSAVSRRIKFMEEQYGYALLDRSRPVLQPTTAGEIVIEKARQILSLEGELLRGLETLKGKRSFSFCCTPAFGVSHLPRVLHTFMLRNSELLDVKFVFDTPARIVEGLRNGLYDLAVIEHCEDFDLGEFSPISLPGDEVVFVSASDRGIPSGMVDLGALLDMPLVSRKVGCCSRKLLEINLEDSGASIADFAKVVILDDLRLIVSAVAEGNGVTFISTDVAGGCLSAGRLSEHRVAGFQHTRRRSLVCNAEFERGSFLAEFVESVRTTLGSEGARVAKTARSMHQGMGPQEEISAERG